MQADLYSSLYWNATNEVKIPKYLSGVAEDGGRGIPQKDSKRLHLKKAPSWLHFSTFGSVVCAGPNISSFVFSAYGIWFANTWGYHWFCRLTHQTFPDTQQFLCCLWLHAEPSLERHGGRTKALTPHVSSLWAISVLLQLRLETLVTFGSFLVYKKLKCLV